MKRFALAFAIAMISATASAAPVSALQLNTVGTSTFNYSPTLGWSFTATSNIFVSALGQWDDLDNGLSATSTVSIWNASSQLLASAVVGSGTSGSLVDHYRYASIGGITLLAGQTYYVGSNFTGAVMRTDSGGYSYTAAAPISNVVGAYSNSANGVPFNSLNSSAVYGGANFLIGQAVPEPGSLALLGLGMAGLLAMRRRKAA